MLVESHKNPTRGSPFGQVVLELTETPCVSHVYCFPLGSSRERAPGLPPGLPSPEPKDKDKLGPVVPGTCFETTFCIDIGAPNIRKLAAASKNPSNTETSQCPDNVHALSIYKSISTTTSTTTSCATTTMTTAWVGFRVVENANPCSVCLTADLIHLTQ